ncbi:MULTISPECIES: TetR/AcrR family transcriptional regulator [unclassified Actinomyces]|uniref:TetR/AcrR family transcriptional regulator n=1 Tax=unclassified Actinomyces TaxID=2609248 RepID=UPI000D59D57D|nr:MULTISPECIES: TetR/AcrR family transcriptional regulator [unclassified Actinomyces]RAX21721.1 TetR/AcrR family transcriptional regulator [Actinomyces sp. Z3]
MPRVTQSYRDRQTARIVAAAEVCFARRGFDGASMDEIIAEAGMSSATVYRYFPQGKESLIRAVLGQATDPVVEWMARLSAGEELPPFESAFIDAVEQAWSYKASVGADSEGGVRADAGAEGAGRTVAPADLQAAIWAELARQPDLRAANAESYARVRSETARILGRWQARGDVAGHLDPEAAAAVVHHAAMGLLVRRIVVGEPGWHDDVVATARALAGMLGAERAARLSR